LDGGGRARTANIALAVKRRGVIIGGADGDTEGDGSEIVIVASGADRQASPQRLVAVAAGRTG
jgi:hypothetical protein